MQNVLYKNSLYQFIFVSLIITLSMPILGGNGLPKPSSKIPDLITATHKNNIPAVHWHIQNKTDLNIQNRYGNTALIVASLNGNTIIANLLIKAGAKINIVNTSNCTALTMAAHDNNFEITQLLIKSGAKLNIQSSIGNTALDYASGKTEVLLTIAHDNKDCINWQKFFKNKNIPPLKFTINCAHELGKLKLLDDAYSFAKKHNQLIRLATIIDVEKVKSNKKLRQHFANKALQSEDYKLAAQYFDQEWPHDKTEAKKLFVKAKKLSSAYFKRTIENKLAYIRAYNDIKKNVKLTPKFNDVTFNWKS